MIKKYSEHTRSIFPYFNHKNASKNIKSIPERIQINIGNIARMAPRIKARCSFFVSCVFCFLRVPRFGSYQLNPSTFISANVVSVSRLSIFFRFSLFAMLTYSLFCLSFSYRSTVPLQTPQFLPQGYRGDKRRNALPLPHDTEGEPVYKFPYTYHNGYGIYSP